MIAACVHDYMSEGRAAFHPVENTASYRTQVAEAAVAVAKFVAPEGRYHSWMAYFEKGECTGCHSPRVLVVYVCVLIATGDC
jgi:hypothetical protein